MYVLALMLLYIERVTIFVNRSSVFNTPQGAKEQEEEEEEQEEHNETTSSFSLVPL